MPKRKYGKKKTYRKKNTFGSVGGINVGQLKKWLNFDKQLLQLPVAIANQAHWEQIRPILRQRLKSPPKNEFQLATERAEKLNKKAETIAGVLGDYTSYQQALAQQKQAKQQLMDYVQRQLQLQGIQETPSRVIQTGAGQPPGQKVR
jgi:hypothetical protein